MAEEGSILPAMRADGLPPPDWATPPTLRAPLWVQLVIAAFWDLSTERAIGFGGVGPIPWSRIVERGSMARPVGAGLRGDDLGTFVASVRACDAAYLAHVQKQQRSAEAAKGGAP